MIPPLLLASTPPPAAPTTLVRPQTVTPLPGALDGVLVVNDNNPELITAPGILLSTFPAAGRPEPRAHLDVALNGRFDLFSHHVYAGKPESLDSTLWLAVLAQPRGTEPVTLKLLGGSTALSQATDRVQPSAPFLPLPAVLPQDGSTFSGPGSRVATELLIRQRSPLLPDQWQLPPNRATTLVVLPLPVKGLDPLLNGRNLQLRLQSSGPVSVATLAAFGTGDQPPPPESWAALLNGPLSPKEHSPTPRGSKGQLIYSRVSGVQVGSVWRTTLTDPGKRWLSASRAPISWPISSLERGSLGSGQVQTAELQALYPGTAWAAHGNYGVEYDLSIPLRNDSNGPAAAGVSPGIAAQIRPGPRRLALQHHPGQGRDVPRLRGGEWLGRRDRQTHGPPRLPPDPAGRPAGPCPGHGEPGPRGPAAAAGAADLPGRCHPAPGAEPVACETIASKPSQQPTVTQARKRRVFPFTAIVGQEEMKLALLLNVIDPRIGGVMIMGDRGTGKSTTIRALADLLPEIDVVAGDPYNSSPQDPDLQSAEVRQRAEHGEALPTEKRQVPMVDLPLGATEDRLCGTIDIEKALSEGVRAFEPGLLAKANRGLLYVDEVNLLDDHLVDVLLDSAASGWNTVEREGVSVRHPARFVLIGSGNPEEGELRPQLLDRFGMSVEVRTVRDPELRVQVVDQRTSFDNDPDGFNNGVQPTQDALQARVVEAQNRLPHVQIDDDLRIRISAICGELDVDGLRGDIVTNRAARALAAFEGRTEVTEDDVARVAACCLRHRLRKDPLEQIDSGDRVVKVFCKVFERAEASDRRQFELVLAA